MIASRSTPARTGCARPSWSTCPATAPSGARWSPSTDVEHTDAPTVHLHVDRIAYPRLAYLPALSAPVLLRAT